MSDSLVSLAQSLPSVGVSSARGQMVGTVDRPLLALFAAALAKAQSELVNPEKSLTAIIRTGRPGEGGAASAMRRSRAVSILYARRLGSMRSQPFRERRLRAAWSI
jgi:hypothetical protein